MSSDDDIDQADRRAHHNELERQRRDYLKELFEDLKEEIPKFAGTNRKPSRVEILRGAAEIMTEFQEKERKCAELEDLDAELELFLEKIEDCKKRKDKVELKKLMKKLKKRWPSIISTAESASSPTTSQVKESDSDSDDSLESISSMSLSDEADTDDDDSDDDDIEVDVVH